MTKSEKARRAGRAEEATRHLELAVALDPEYIAARNNLALMYLRADKFDLGTGQLEEAIQIDPHNPMLFQNLAVAHLLANNLAAGERAARESLNLNRADMLAHILLGLVLVQEKKFTDEAVRCLDVAKNESPVIRLTLACTLIRRGNLSQARSELETYFASGELEHRPQATKWLDSINRLSPQVDSQPDTSRPNQ